MSSSVESAVPSPASTPLHPAKHVYPPATYRHASPTVATFQPSPQALRNARKQQNGTREHTVNFSQFKVALAPQSATQATEDTNPASVATESPSTRETAPDNPRSVIDEQTLQAARQRLKPTHPEGQFSKERVDDLHALKRTLVTFDPNATPQARRTLASALQQWQADNPLQNHQELKQSITALTEVLEAKEHTKHHHSPQPAIHTQLQQSLHIVQKQLLHEYDTAGRNFNAARENARQTAQQTNQEILQANQQRWRSQSFTRLVGLTADSQHKRSHSTSQGVSAGDQVLQAALKRSFSENGIDKVEKNWQRLLTGLSILKTQDAQVDGGSASNSGIFAKVKLAAEKIQGLVKTAYQAVKIPEDAQRKLNTAEQQFSQAVDQLEQLSQTIAEKQIYLYAVDSLETLSHQLQHAGEVAADDLANPLVPYLLSTEGAEALEKYRSLVSSRFPDLGQLHQIKNDLRLAIETSLQQAGATDRLQVRDALKEAEAAVEKVKTQADNAHNRMLKLVAGYGQDAQAIKALKSEYQEKMTVALLKVLRYGNKLSGDAFSGTRLLMGLLAPKVLVEATRPALTVAGGALSGTANVFGLGITTYEIIKDGIDAFQNHQTKKKASFLQRHFAEPNPETGRPRDAELSEIARTLKHKQSQFRNTKLGHIIVNSIQGVGYVAGAFAAAASIAATITGGGAAAAVSAVATPVGWALAGLGVLSLGGYIAYRLISWGAHHYQSNQLKKVVAGDAKAIASYRKKHELTGLDDQGIQQHAINTLTQHSGKFALQRLHQRLKAEVQNLDRAYWDQAPTICFLKTFFKDEKQIEALTQVDDKKAIKVMAKALQIKT